MKFTLLEIVQDILNDIDGDEVDSISDNSEATQVANIVRSTYNHIVSQVDIPKHQVYFKLDETTSTTPTLMTLPADILKTYWVSYDLKNEPGAFSGGVFSGSAFDTTEGSYFPPGGILYRDPASFFDYIAIRKWTGTQVDAYTFTTGRGDTFEVKYLTDTNPSCYTVLEDYYVIFDALDTDISVDYLEADLTWCYGLKEPTFTLSDGFTPDLNETEFNWLIEESKSAASIKLRQVQDPKAEQRARRGWIRSQNNKWSAPHQKLFDRLPNYGRK